MRVAFGDDEGAEPLRAEIALSSGQAGRGAAVPVEVSVRRTCRVCGGRGETWDERCGCCFGSGHALIRQHLTVSVPAGVAHGDRFAFCVAYPRGPRTRVELRVAVT
jgi:molecular chaperone DnaJ